jgi:MFS family permease
VTRAAAPHRLVTPTFAALSIATLVFYVASGVVVVIAPVFGAEAIGLSKAAVGVAIAIYSIAALVMRPVVGWTTDRFGRRVALLAGGALTVGGLLAHLVASNVVPFVVARCILGAGEAFWLVAALAAAADLAPDGRRGESLSLLTLTLYVGLAIGPWLAEAALAATHSFGVVWLATAAVAAISLGLAWFVPETAPGRGGSAGDTASGTDAAGATGAAGPSPRPRLIHPAGILPGLVIFLGMSGMAYFLTFLPLYARTIGLDGAGLPLALYGLIVVVLRLAGARLPDRIGAVRLSGSALVGAALGLVIVATVPTLGGLLAGTALFAFGVAFIMPALLSLTMARVPPEERGTVVGTATLFLDLAFGIAPVVLGGLAELGGYAAGFVGAAAISGLGAVLLVVGLRARPDVAPAATLRP